MNEPTAVKIEQCCHYTTYDKRDEEHYQRIEWKPNSLGLLPSIVVEQTNYSDTGPLAWAVSTSSVGTMLPAYAEEFLKALDNAVEIMRQLNESR